jgi:iron complex outermembrane receptor protein
MRLDVIKTRTFPIACLLFAAQAVAQTPLLPASPAVAPAPVDASAEQVVQLDAITISGLREKGFVPKNSAAGTKTIVPLIEAPQSISVITSDQMAAQGARGLDDAIKYSSGVIGNPYGFDPRTDWLYVRGFQPTRYIDGLAMPDGVWTGVTRWEPYGFERVEILKGASSALYGTMPVGGLVNASTKRPVRDPFGEISVSFGSFDQHQTALDAGGPLNARKTLLYRVTGLARSGDTVLDYSEDNRQFIAPALTWVIDAGTYITLLARYQRDTSRGVLGFLPTQGTTAPNPNGRIPIERYTGEPGFDHYDKALWSIGYEAGHRFNRSWRARQNLRVVGADIDQALIGGLGLQEDMRTLNRYSWTPREKSAGIAVDTQVIADLATGAITHEVLVGVDYLHGRNDARAGMGFGVATLDIFAPVYGTPIATPADSSHTVQRQNQLALYAQDRIKWKNLLLTLGARQDFVSLKTDDRMGTADESRSNRQLSGRAGLGYVFDSGLTPYAAWSTSFQPNLGTDYYGRAFVPTKGTLAELGVKYQPRGYDALFTAAVYESTRRNVLTTDTTAPIFGYDTQQGKTRVRGFEVEARATLFKTLTLIGAHTRTDSEVRETSVATDLGKSEALVPRNRFGFWADYTIAKGLLRDLGFAVGVTYNSAVYGDSANLYKGDSATLWDAALHYNLARWRFQLNASNLFDKRCISAVQSPEWAFYGNPRVVTASATYKF